MPNKKRRGAAKDAPDRDLREKHSPPVADDRERMSSAGRNDDAFRDDDDFGTDLSNITDAHPTYEPDPREVDMLTDQIFGSVLSRFGWQRHEGRFEHVGENEKIRRR